MKYAAKRIAMLFATMLIVSLLAFVAFDLISGDAASAMLGTEATPEKIAELRSISVEEAQRITTENGKRLYRIDA